MAKLFKVPDQKLRPVVSVVDKLEHLLKRAERGEIRSIAYALEYKESVPVERGTEWGIAGEPWASPLLGAIDILKAQMTMTAINDSGVL